MSPTTIDDIENQYNARHGSAREMSSFPRVIESLSAQTKAQLMPSTPAMPMALATN
jgi:hypothetical protein